MVSERRKKLQRKAICPNSAVSLSPPGPSLTCLSWAKTQRHFFLIELSPGNHSWKSGAHTSVPHGSYTFLVVWLGLGGLEGLRMTATLFPQATDPFRKPVGGLGGGAHHTRQEQALRVSGNCTAREGEGCCRRGGGGGGAGVAVAVQPGGQADLASPCLQGGGHFGDRRFPPAANEQSFCPQRLWGSREPTAHLLPEPLCHRLSLLLRIY